MPKGAGYGKETVPVLQHCPAKRLPVAAGRGSLHLYWGLVAPSNFLPLRDYIWRVWLRFAPALAAGCRRTGAAEEAELAGVLHIFYESGQLSALHKEWKKSCVWLAGHGNNSFPALFRSKLSCLILAFGLAWGFLFKYPFCVRGGKHQPIHCLS